jgi:4,5-dihydroxyphthalate decarboxylase
MTYRVSLGDYPNIRPLVDGRIPVDDRSSITLSNKVDVLAAARRMCRELAYDVAEVPMVTYLVAREAGVPITAIPVFPNRALPHYLMHAPTGRPVAPEDLKGARIGVRAWTVTSAVWGRAVLADLYEVDLSTVDWIAAGEEHVAGTSVPDSVAVRPGLSLPAELAAGRLDAVVGVNIDHATHPGVGPLFADTAEAARVWLRSGRPYPVNHTVCVRNELLEQDPGYVASLYDALTRAHAATRDERQALAEARFGTGIEADHPHEYGWDHNRPAVEYLAAAALRQSVLRSDAVGAAFWRADG